MKWAPRDIITLLAVGAACGGFLAVTLGSVVGLFAGVITSEILGTISGITAGGGLLGFGIISYLIISKALTNHADTDNSQSKSDIDSHSSIENSVNNKSDQTPKLQKQDAKIDHQIDVSTKENLVKAGDPNG